MRQCMRCGNACQATFCDNCRLFLQGQLPKGGITSTEVSVYDTAPLPAINNPVTPFPLVNDFYATQVERGIQAGDPVTPLPPLNAAYGMQAEQALQNLQDAARRIAAVEQNAHRTLHASRLSPLRDISADIQRKNTPGPRTLQKSGEEEIEDLGDIPNLWAWFSSLLEEEDEEQEDEERWEGAADPLSSRHFPQRAESARIEMEDLKRAVSDGLATTAEVEIFKRLRAKQRLRWLFICVAIVAVVVLIIDIVLVAFFLRH